MAKKETYKVGTTTFYKGTNVIKSLGLPVKKFKKIVTEKDYGFTETDFQFTIKVGNRDHIHDFFPRIVYGVDLFSKYHGRQSCEIPALVGELRVLYFKAKESAKKEVHNDD